jgi:hypothetical protein
MQITQEENLKIMSIEDMKFQELALSLKTWNQVLLFAIRHAGLTQDSVRLGMKYDKGTFSRILSGDAHMPPDRLNEFNEIVGHKLTLVWLCLREGYEVRVLPKTLEEKLIEKERVIEEQARKIQNYEECFAKLGAKIKE